MKKLTVIILSLLLSLSFSACGSNAPSPTDVSKDFMEAIKNKDNDSLKSLYAGEVLNITDGIEVDADESAEMKSLYEEMYAKLFEFDYKVSNEKINDQKATVDVEITTYQLGQAFKDFVGDYMKEAFSLGMAGASDDAVEKKGVEILSNKLGSMKKDYSQTVTLRLTLQDDAWVVDELKKDSDFYNALTGGAVQVGKDMNSALSEESDNSTDNAKKVDKINIDNSEGTLTYTKHETINDEANGPLIRIYFDYTNKKADATSAQGIFYPEVFQEGIERDLTTTFDNNKAEDNAYKDIQKGTKVQIAFVYSLDNLKSPVTLKVSDQSSDNLLSNIYQEQELSLK